MEKYQPTFKSNPVTDPHWFTLNSQLKKQAREMQPTEVEIAFEEAVKHLLEDHRRDLREFLRTIAEGLKKFTRQEHVYRTRLRQMYAENRELQERVMRLERYEASVQGFDDTPCIPMEALPNDPDGYVYVIRDLEVTGFYKIGVTASGVKKRLKELTLMPFRMGVVYLIKSEDYYLIEGSLHTHFRNNRVRGEWFELSSDDIEWIKLTYPGA